MLELWDIYDDNNNKTGEIIERGNQLQDGKNHLVVNIYPINKNKQILIQKRVNTLNSWPGFWAVTGGSAIVGENSWETCRRELKEELGIEALKSNSFLVRVVKHPHSFCNIWIIKDNTEISDLKLQPEEVADVKWVTIEEIKDLIAKNIFVKYDYIEWFLENLDFLTNKFFK